MATDPQARRRRAAAAVFSPLLDDAGYEDAIRLAGDWRDDSVAQIIGYVDRVARQTGLDPATCKRIYAELHGLLRGAEDALPADPQPVVESTRSLAPTLRTPAPAPMAMPTPTPTPTAVPPVDAPSALLPPPAATEPAVPPERVIFAAAMRSIVADVVQFHNDAIGEFVEALQIELARAPIADALRDAVGVALESIGTSGWRLIGSATEFADVLHLVYIALCRAIGPTEADRYLNRAIEAAGRLPQARAFPPSQLF